MTKEDALDEALKQHELLQGAIYWLHDDLSQRLGARYDPEVLERLKDILEAHNSIRHLQHGERAPETTKPYKHERKCVNCSYWGLPLGVYDRENYKGDCRYNPPNRDGDWSQSNGYDWCGKFRLRVVP